jgi:hypothetical protein
LCLRGKLRKHKSKNRPYSFNEFVSWKNKEFVKEKILFFSRKRKKL